MKTGTFLHVEKQGSHYIAVFRGLRDMFQMDQGELIKRIHTLKKYEIDASEGEKALKCLEEVSK